MRTSTRFCPFAKLFQKDHYYAEANLILFAFITGNSNLESLIEGLCAESHVNLR